MKLCPKCNLRLWSIDKGVCPNEACTPRAIVEQPEPIVNGFVSVPMRTRMPQVKPRDWKSIKVPEIIHEYNLEENLRNHVLSVLNHYNGDRYRTSAALGILPKTLYNKLKKWGILEQINYGI